MRLILFLAVAAALSSCATPATRSSGPKNQRADHSEYRVEDHADGFTVEMDYSRYQFIPESDAVAAAAKSNLTATCYEVADKKGREIQPINEQRIKMSMGRNGFTGITSWSGSARAFYR